MGIRIHDILPPVSMEPLTCRRGFTGIFVGGMNLAEAVERRVRSLVDVDEDTDISVNINFWPSPEIVKLLVDSAVQVLDQQGLVVAVSGNDSEKRSTVMIDAGSLIIRYPWDVLAINEEIVGALERNNICGDVSEFAVVEGTIVVGEGSRILPGVFIEGNVVIGKDCKIGPNCYIRGNSLIMDGCHIGQAVEIKNSILMEQVSAGHLSYIGDSIVCPGTNFGAGTVTANFRHDGMTHRSTVEDELVDTGRRKFGSVIGDNVHTGIHTGIYPGRKIWPDMMTRPGDIVQRDLR